ncbi:MAG: S-methyl-5-thioribose-1-phosphate isomerase [Gammaproteobacteria bacterium]|nr:S-methyl-5-thioribose-1-phosphate isomerase [Gammaproteobacteria bacterium]MCF6362072.1 S-methyl-5-thioribose-1-phosphate isomerase [Gammaproteobacteria bacterium]
MTDQADTVEAIRWQENKLQLLDQRVLPHEIAYLTYGDAHAVADAIRDMVVRGAPAIGITAAYGIVLAARACFAQSPVDWKRAIEADLQTLTASRPTAVNLFWAIERMREVIAGIEGDPEAALLAEARRIHDDDIAANRHMGELGAALIEAPCAILTHCNAGALATGGYGTALGVVRAGFAAGKITSVYADETRPWMQGARLTAWEMVQEGIPVTLQAEGAAAHLMKQGRVGWVIVGSDRITANGDVVNKIGTYGLAVLARHHGVKFMVVAPASTVDMSIACGDDVAIEQRSPDEVLYLAGQRIAAEGAEAWNPAFDVTPAALVDAIVTERGVVRNPDVEKMRAMMERA